MSRLIKKVFSKAITGWLVGASFVVAPLAVQAATNTFTFNNTTISSGAGPSNPANGATSISGTNLNTGDVVVFDGVVINVPGSTSDAWGAVDLNAGGYLGLTGAALGVLAETGTANANDWQLFLNGTGSTHLGSAALDSKTNRIHIELTCTQTGSTTNMNYLVEIDQGASGTYNASLSGTNVNFGNNAIALSFGANNAAHLFIQVQPIIAVSAPTPATNIVVAGLTATFSATITQGYPLNTSQQWRSNGVPIAGATGLTYTTTPVTASYNGAQYSIVVTNLLTPGNVVTSSVAVLVVRTTPGIVTFNFPTTTTAAGGGAVTTPGVSISGNSLILGDTVVFDGIITPNGAQPSDAWTAVNIAGSGYGNVVNAIFGVLCRQGSGFGQLFTNGIYITANSPTQNGAPTNRVRIELYPSATGSTTNMGWMVEIDQNLTGTFLPALTGTNLTFVNNTLPLTFGSSGGSSFVFQDPQSPVSIFSQPNPFQVVAAGSPVSVGVTVSGWYPAFQWRKNGAVIQNATNQTYTLASAALADNGDKFTVVVSNRLDSLNVVTSTVANVSVLIPNNLSWYPLTDTTTWDTATPNWTTNGGVTLTTFSSGNNVTMDILGFNIGGTFVTLNNTVNPNAVTVNVNTYVQYVLSGAGSVNGQSLLVTGDGTGGLCLQTPAADSFASATIASGTLQIGYLGVDSAFQANYITNNGTIDFQNAAGVLTIPGVITGSGSIIQDGTGTTILSATNSAYGISAINSGVLLIASTPNPGGILNNSELQPNSPASVLFIPNAVTGGGHYAFTGFQTTILTGLSSFTGANRLAWGPVIVDNPHALGDTNSGHTAVTGADNLGGLYLSNNIIWTQPLELDPRLNAGGEATAPHISNWSGTNIITSALTFATGQGGSELNVEATRGLLTIDGSSTLANSAGNNANNLNLQGAAGGIWNGILKNGTTSLNVVKRGTGTWTLGGANTYSGTTTVANGTLLITNLSATTNVSVQSGATLGCNGAVIAGSISVTGGGTLVPGLPGGNGAGVLTINSNLTLSAGSFTSVQINKTGATRDQIVGVNTLTYGGTLVVSNLSGTLTTNDTFHLFSATGYTGTFGAVSPASPGTGLAWNTTTLAVDGTLRIATASASPNPTNITAKMVGGNTLSLAWPANQGWTLEVQTNPLQTGLGTNWFRISSSTATNQADIPIVTTNGSVFYRLIYP
jgi:autotransporter-associated beta strand protein